MQPSVYPLHGWNNRREHQWRSAPVWIGRFGRRGRYSLLIVTALFRSRCRRCVGWRWLYFDATNRTYFLNQTLMPAHCARCSDPTGFRQAHSRAHGAKFPRHRKLRALRNRQRVAKCRDCGRGNNPPSHLTVLLHFYYPIPAVVRLGWRRSSLTGDSLLSIINAVTGCLVTSRQFHWVVVQSVPLMRGLCVLPIAQWAQPCWWARWFLFRWDPLKKTHPAPSLPRVYLGGVCDRAVIARHQHELHHKPNGNRRCLLLQQSCLAARKVRWFLSVFFHR